MNGSDLGVRRLPVHDYGQ